MNEIQIDKGERLSSPTHAGEETNINNTQDYTEPNVLGAAPLFASVDGFWGDAENIVYRFPYNDSGQRNLVSYVAAGVIAIVSGGLFGLWILAGCRLF